MKAFERLSDAVRFRNGIIVVAAMVILAVEALSDGTRAPGGLSDLVVPAALAAEPLSAAGLPAAPPARILAIGDIHGDFDSFVALLRRAGLVDEHLTWTGGTTTLVQTGDFTDRGPKVRQVIDLLMALDWQASHAGGRLLVVLGNHEVMNVMRDVRDVAPDAYQAFADERSAARQSRAYRDYVDFIAAREAAGVKLTLRDREEWLRSHPPGYVEYAEAFDAGGIYGRWLRSLPVVVSVGDTAFLHAGIDPDGAPRRLDDVNSRIRAEIQKFDEFRQYLIRRRLILPSFTLHEVLEVALAELTARKAGFTGSNTTWADDAFERRDEDVLAAVLRIGMWEALRPEGPLWFRGFATWSEEEGQALVRKLSDRYQVAHWVVGHTITRSLRVTSRFKSGVFLIDTGMLATHNAAGRASALEIQNGRFTAMSLDEGMTPADDDSPQVGHVGPRAQDSTPVHRRLAECDILWIRFIKP